MLRAIFVGAIVTVGGLSALRSPFASLLFYLWIAYFRPEAWVWGDWLTSLHLSWWAGLLLVGRFLVSPSGVTWNWRIGLVLLFLVHNALSLGASKYSEYLVEPFTNFAISLVVAYLITCLAADVIRFRQVLLVIGLSLGAEAAKQGWAGLLLRPGGENINTIPFLGDNNIVAVGMLMLLPVLVAVARTSKRRWARLGHRLVAIGVLYRSLSTYSRGGFLACAAVGGMYVLRSRHRLAAMLIVVTVAAGIAPVMPDAFWARIDTIFADADERDRSATGRLHFWSVAVDMARAHPLLGVGHWGYNHAYDAFDPTRGDFGQSRSVHSVWFGLLAELGYPGLLLFLCILLAHWGAIRTVRLASQRNAVPAELGHYAFALEASLVAFVVGGTFLPIHYNEMVWQFFALGIALHRACGTAEVSADHEGVRNVPISGAYLQPHQVVSRYSATISRDPMWPFAP